MKTSNRGRKGMTLAELAVVIGVVAIVATMVVSFSVVIGNKTRVSEDRLEAMDEIQLVESAVERWADEYAYISALRIGRDGALYCEYEDHNEGKTDTWVTDLTTSLEYKFEHIKSIDIQNSFPELIDSNKGIKYGRLYIITLTYDIADEEQTHTFCVNPYVREEVSQ